MSVFYSDAVVDECHIHETQLSKSDLGNSAWCPICQFEGRSFTVYRAKHPVHEEDTSLEGHAMPINTYRLVGNALRALSGGVL